jgi:hypothetical protein
VFSKEKKSAVCKEQKAIKGNKWFHWKQKDGQLIESEITKLRCVLGICGRENFADEKLYVKNKLKTIENVELNIYLDDCLEQPISNNNFRIYHFNFA